MQIHILNALCLWKAESCVEIRKYIATIQKDDSKAFDALVRYNPHTVFKILDTLRSKGMNGWLSLCWCVVTQRGSEVGTDDKGVSYWYFGDGCWVYAEDKPQWQREQRCEPFTHSSS